ncbi:lipoprotein LpqH [uncultured Propionibacterium sp.]|uniref:lipoprotein LpqH n=1 Tax=uncultured Propionibacterium sp. TaxID=218066 RepID=UPI00292D3BB7|nr:lipoprotein LpqH [uncultured Propionibacterium sp.]
MEKATVACSAENGSKTVHAASTTTGQTSTFTATLDDADKVSMVMAAESGTQVLNFMDAAGIGHAEATVDGSTYTIKGEAPAETATDASAPLKSFEATITCSS